MLNHNNRICIFYYHSVGDNNSHQWNDNTLSVRVFERQMKYLSDNYFKSISLTEMMSFIKSESNLPDKNVVLTFDDGYLDNWVYVYPILKKYGIKATIFVNPAFVDPSAAIRPTSEDVLSGKIRADELKWWGYLSWQEINALSSSGLVDIQSHGLTHNWYFSSRKLVDYHHPGDPYYWYQWNLKPELKPFWLDSDTVDESHYGAPIYEHGRGFIVRRYLEDTRLAQHLKNHVSAHGGKAFFDRPTWRDDLDRVNQDYQKSYPLQDSIETEQAYLQRVTHEMSESRRIIEMNTGKPVQFLCWPNGGYNEEVHRIATEDLGYTATVIVDECSDLSPRYSNLLGRVSFGQHYQGIFRDWVHFLKFVSAVESRSGCGTRRSLILLYQHIKQLIKKSFG
jgi:peptidoglycan/xylan/chitin deacetylase (PgdA/CDA1 family)